MVFDYAGSVAPDGFLLCYGQAISRTTYSRLFAAISTAFGVGDGSTTFNIPDCRGRIIAGKDDMGGTAANALNATLTGTKASTSSGVITGLSSTAALTVGMKAFGTGIGAAAVITTIDSATQVTLSVNSTSTGSTSIRFGVVDGATLGAVGGAHTHQLTTPQVPVHSHVLPFSANTLRSTGSGSETVMESLGPTSPTNSAGGDQSHPNVQPTIIFNKIIKT